MRRHIGQFSAEMIVAYEFGNLIHILVGNVGCGITFKNYGSITNYIVVNIKKNHISQVLIH